MKLKNYFMKFKVKKQSLFNGIIILCVIALVVNLNLISSKLNSLGLKDIEGVEFYEAQVNLYDESGCEDYFYDYDGNKVETQNGSVMSNWIECEPGQQLTRNGIATNVVCYFDQDKNFIERVDSYGLSTITVPSNNNIAYVRMAVVKSDSQKIVYGSTIADEVVSGDYYAIDDLKIFDYNQVNDSSIVESPNGKRWQIFVDDEGNLQTKDVTNVLVESDLPPDFPKFEIVGESITDEDILITMNESTENGYGYIFILSSEGDVKWYKQVPNYAFNFRKIQYEDGTIRYAYQEVHDWVDEINGGILYTHIVLMDEQMNVINDNIHPLKYGSIDSDNFACENHDYKILGDNHYILMTVTKEVVRNVPGYENQDVQVVNAIIQEQKDGEVIMQWESIDHPELYEASVYNNDYSIKNTSYYDWLTKLKIIIKGCLNFVTGDFDAISEAWETIQKKVYNDYVHVNAVTVDPNTYDLLISCRSIGLIKLERETGDIMWIMGRGHNDISGMESEECGLYQHDVRYLEDGSFTIFDNSGGENLTSRVCRYWIDEENLELENIEIFTTEHVSTAMGCASLVDDETDTYTIVYGSGIGEFQFEERDFSTNEANMQFKLDGGSAFYRVFRGVEVTPVE